MNIVINAVLAFEKPRGVGRYLNNLLPEIAKLDKENQYYVYYGKWMKEYSFLNINQENIHFIELNIKNTQISRNLYLAFSLPLACKKYHPDVFFLIDTQAIIIKPCKIISTIHDLAEFVVPEKYSKKQALIRREIVKHQIKISDEIMTVSMYSKNDICNRFKVLSSKVHVIYNSVEPPNIKHIMPPDNYFLFVSETEKAKNLMLLIKAYNLLPDAMKDKYKIYVVGKHGNDHENILSEIARTGIKDKVKFFGYVSDEELNSIYARAYAFIFPSLFEGFGLPVLEAMSKGTPVLCSNVSSIPEVGGEAVLIFNPYDEKELASQIETLIEVQGKRDEMIYAGIERAKMFSPQKSALDTLKIINAMKK